MREFRLLAILFAAAVTSWAAPSKAAIVESRPVVAKPTLQNCDQIVQQNRASVLFLKDGPGDSGDFENNFLNENFALNENNFVDAGAAIAMAPDLILIKAQDDLTKVIQKIQTVRAIQSEKQSAIIIWFESGYKPKEVSAVINAGANDFLDSALTEAEIIFRIKVLLKRRELGTVKYDRGALDPVAALDLLNLPTMAINDDGIQAWQSDKSRIWLGSFAELTQANPDFETWFNQTKSEYHPKLNSSPKLLQIKDRKFLLRLTKSKSDNLWLIQFSEFQSPYLRLKEKFGITKREFEVLYWASRGLENPEIGKILNMALGTVKKTNEHIHEKLFVETQSAAIYTMLRVVPELIFLEWEDLKP